MKYKEKQILQKSTIQDLAKEALALEEKLKKIEVDRHIKQMKNTREGRNIRRRLAVIVTIIKEKQQASESLYQGKDV